MAYKQIQVRRDTSTNWTSNNPILASGEFGYETNTKKTKMGDGVTPWNALAYIRYTNAEAVSAVNAETSLTVDITGNANTVDSYHVQKDGTDGAGVINFKTV